MMNDEESQKAQELAEVLHPHSPYDFKSCLEIAETIVEWQLELLLAVKFAESCFGLYTASEICTMLTMGVDYPFGSK